MARIVGPDVSAGVLHRVLVLVALVASAFAVSPAAGAAPVSVPSGVDPGGVPIVSHRPRGEVRAASVDGVSTMIVRFAEGIGGDQSAQALADAGVTVYDTYVHVFAGASVGATSEQVASMRADPRIAAVEADRAVTATDVPSRSAVHPETVQSSAPWGLDRIDQRDLPLSGTYQYVATGAGVTAYVLDSGVRGDHVDFGGRVVAGTWLQPLYSGPGDCEGHGTHVAGILGSNTYGVARAVTIHPIRVLDCDGAATLADMLQAYDYVIEDHQAGRPAVLNISVGGNANAEENLAVQAMIDDGVTVVVAAGNEGTLACSLSPASAPGAITVAATDPTDRSPDWSNYGSCVDVFAPGEDIVSLGIATPTSTKMASGTSMAAPFAAGLAALLLQQNPTATPAQIAAQIVAQATTGHVTNEGAGSPNRLLFTAPASQQPPVAFHAQPPARLLDTRAGSPTVDGLFAGIGLRGGGTVLELQVTGRAGIPGDAATASLNVTVSEAQGSGFVTVYPCGQARPTASNLNFGVGDTVPNAVITQIGVGGKVCLFTYAATQLIVDVNGWFPPTSSFQAGAPARLLDTRAGSPTVDGLFAGIGLRGGGTVLELQVTGRAGIPGDAATASLNVTVSEAQGSGFVTVYPCGQARPTASNLNFGVGDTVPNAVITQIGVGGKVCLFTYAATQLIVDVNGWFFG